MPRVSSAALAAVPACELEFLPPPHLSADAAVIFRDVIASADKGHFRHEDRMLLSLYCCHCVEAQRLMRKRRLSHDERCDLSRLTSVIMALSVKLRIGPKSRHPNHRRGQNAGLAGGVEPWELGQNAPEKPKARPPVDWNER